jgi:hypothetical protein
VPHLLLTPTPIERTLAMLVSISEGEALEGELAAILLRAADIFAIVVEVVEVVRESYDRETQNFGGVRTDSGW